MNSIISSSSSSSSSSSRSSSGGSSNTQRAPRGPVDEMHVFFQKNVFSPRPETTVQVNFNAKTHLLNLKCKKKALAWARCTFSSLHLYYTND